MREHAPTAVARPSTEPIRSSRYADCAVFGCARLAHAESIEAEQYGERSMIAVVLRSAVNRNTPSSERSRPGAFEGMYLRSMDVLRRVRGDATIDVREAVEAAHSRPRPPI